MIASPPLWCARKMMSRSNSKGFLTKPVLILLGVSIAFTFDFMMFLSAAPQLVRIAGGQAVAGLVTSTLLFTAVATRFLFPRFQNLLPGKMLGIIAQALMACGALMFFVINTDPILMFVAAVIRGLGFGSLTILAQGMVVKYTTPENRGRTLGVIGVSSTFSAVLGPPIGLALIENNVLAGPGILGCAMGMVSITLLLILRSDDSTFSKPARTQRWDTLYHALKNAPILRLSLITSVLVSVAWAGVATFAPMILSDREGITGALYTLIYFGMTATARWFCGILQDRFSVRLHTLYVAIMGISGALVLLNSVHTSWAGICSAILLGASMGWFQNVIYYLILENQKYSSFVLSAVNANSIDLGGLIGTAALSGIVFFAGTEFVLAIIAVIVVLAVIPLTMLRRLHADG